MADKIGEIIEVNSSGFTAQCVGPRGSDEPSLCDPPDFGSFVKIGEPPAESSAQAAPARVDFEEPDPFARPAKVDFDRTLAPNLTFALVSHAQTGSLAPGRRPTALGIDTEDEMRAQYPQVFELLTTEFSGLLIGFTDHDGRIRRYLPPRPPRVHTPVRECTVEEVAAITSNLSFLRFVLAVGSGLSGPVPPDALVAASLRQAFEARGGEIDFIENAGRTLLPMLGDDYERLKGIIGAAIE